MTGRGSWFDPKHVLSVSTLVELVHPFEEIMLHSVLKCVQNK